MKRLVRINTNLKWHVTFERGEGGIEDRGGWQATCNVDGLAASGKTYAELLEKIQQAPINLVRQYQGYNRLDKLLKELGWTVDGPWGMACDIPRSSSDVDYDIPFDVSFAVVNSARSPADIGFPNLRGE